MRVWEVEGLEAKGRKYLWLQLLHLTFATFAPLSKFASLRSLPNTCPFPQGTSRKMRIEFVT